MRRLRFVGLLILLLATPALAKNFIQCSVRVSGKTPFKVDSIYPGKKSYLEVKGLAAKMGWRLGSGSKKVVKLDNHTFTDFKRYKRKTYVSTDAVAQKFGYKATVKSGGLVVDLWPVNAATAGSTVNLSVRLLKKEKLPSPMPDHDTLRLTLSVRNPGSEIIRLKAKDFEVKDGRGGTYACQGSFDLGVDPGKTSRVDRLYFNVPKKVQATQFRIKNKEGKILGKVRI